MTPTEIEIGKQLWKVKHSEELVRIEVFYMLCKRKCFAVPSLLGQIKNMSFFYAVTY